jgi:hypothetical protein
MREQRSIGTIGIGYLGLDRMVVGFGRREHLIRMLVHRSLEHICIGMTRCQWESIDRCSNMVEMCRRCPRDPILSINVVWRRSEREKERKHTSFASACFGVKNESLGALLFLAFAIIEADNESSTIFQWNDGFSSFATAEDI